MNSLLQQSAPLWSLVLQQPSHPWRAGARIPIEAPRDYRREGDDLIWDEISDGTQTFAVRVTLRAVENEDGFELNLALENREVQLTVREAALQIRGVGTAPDAVLLWPQGLGQRITDLKNLKRELHYPAGTATMPWLALAGECGGVYIGRHDPQKQAVRIAASSSAQGLDFTFTHSPFCAPGQSWQSAPVAMRRYNGSWHTAVKIYRDWFDEASPKRVAPGWATASSGWLLAVLKQQNGDVMWDYRTGIDRLCDIALERGLNTLGLFGWAHGGHDYLYPDYVPDQLMGGEKALRAALARTKARGVRTVLYANGCIMDTGTELYRHRGNNMIALRENSEPYVQSIRKFHSSTPVIFATACHGAPHWRRKMRELAEQAINLGADGILYDQIGVWQPEFCYSKEHRHDSPSTAYTSERASMIEEIAAAAHEINPEFIVMTEGISDLLLGGISYVHGWGTGFSAPGATHNMFEPGEAFPELFRVTFPELPLLQRHSTPMMNRHHANFACVYGFRPEIETRYQPDVAYLTEGILPELSAYADAAYYPPDVALMRGTPQHEATQYLQKVVAFMQRYAEFFWHGQFRDTQGIQCSDGVMAKAYANEKRLAVCAWNPGEAARECQISAPDYSLVECAAPDGEADDSAPLRAQSLRLFIFEKL